MSNWMMSHGAVRVISVSGDCTKHVNTVYLNVELGVTYEYKYQYAPKNGIISVSTAVSEGSGNRSKESPLTGMGQWQGDSFPVPIS
jgi:hypothetical protein